MVLTKNTCFYINSFGLPIINSNILNYVNQYKKVIYSDQWIQDYLSTCCGLFCIAFVLYVKKLSFLSLFKDLKRNDYVVESLLK